MKRLTSPIVIDNRIVLSSSFTDAYQCVLYKDKRLVVIFMDAGDPPDYLFVVPLSEIEKNPLIKKTDSRVSYEGDFYVHASTVWHNEIFFFDDYVAIVEDDCYITVISLTNLQTFDIECPPAQSSDMDSYSVSISSIANGVVKGSFVDENGSRENFEIKF